MNISATTSTWSTGATQRLSPVSQQQASGQDFSIQGGGRPPPPPGPPPTEASLTEGMDTETFARCCRGGAGGPPPDPVASLDTDEDGSIRGEEFGLGEGVGQDELQALFDAMDADGDGGLSSGELESFRESFHAEMAARSDTSMPPPPPSAADGQAFVQQLASLYASMQASGTDSTAA